MAEVTEKVASRSDLEKADRPGRHVEHVYCLRFGEGPVKFGWSMNLGARLRTMGASHWEPITILGAMPGDRRVESKIHQSFLLSRIEMTEWFRPTSDVVDFAKRMAARGLLPEIQSSLDAYECVPIEHIFAGTKGQGKCPTCGR